MGEGGGEEKPGRKKRRGESGRCIEWRVWERRRGRDAEMVSRGGKVVGEKRWGESWMENSWGGRGEETQRGQAREEGESTVGCE